MTFDEGLCELGDQNTAWWREEIRTSLHEERVFSRHRITLGTDLAQPVLQHTSKHASSKVILFTGLSRYVLTVDARLLAVFFLTSRCAHVLPHPDP